MSFVIAPPPGLNPWGTTDFSGICTAPMFAQSAQITQPGAGALSVSYIIAPKTLSVSNFYASVGNNATGTTLARFGIYTANAAGNLVALVARSVDFHAAAGYTGGFDAFSAALDTTGGFTNPYVLQAGVKYGFAFLHVGSSVPPDLVSTSSTGVFNPWITGLGGVKAQSNAAVFTDLPTSLNIGTSGFAGVRNSAIPFIGVL